MGWTKDTTLSTIQKAKKRTFDELFKPSIELKIDDGLKMGVYARSKKGKTRFAASKKAGPTQPKLVIDTENNFKKEMKHWPLEDQQNTMICEVLQFAIEDNEHPEKKKVDLVASLDAAMDAMDVLTEKIIEYNRMDPPIKGTIVIDSATDFWAWMTQWLEEQPDLKRVKSTGDMMRTEWGRANKRYSEFIYMCLTSDWDVIMTFRSFPAISAKGENLGFDEPKWQKQTEFFLDLMTELTSDGQDRVMLFRGDRLGDLKGNIKNPDWGKLVKYIEDQKGIKIS